MLAQAIRTIASSSGPPGLDTSHISANLPSFVMANSIVSFPFRFSDAGIWSRQFWLIFGTTIRKYGASSVRLDSKVHTKVREIPDYAVPPEEVLDPIANEAGRTVLDEEAELPAVAAKEPHIVDPHWQERLEEGRRVIARQTAIREAAAKAEECGARAPARRAVITEAEARPSVVETGALARSASAATAISAGNTTKSSKSEKVNQRKPAATVKPNGHNVEAPHERKNAAQRASAG
jgi:hypothetical protein